MKLFFSPASPFVRKVVIVLHETGLFAETEIVAASGNAIAPGSMPVAENPLGKIPTLLLDDGATLFDSRVICRYLDTRSGRGLYPAGDRLWDCLTREAMADGMSDAAVLCIYEKRLRPESHWHEPWIEGQWAKVARALDRFETLIAAQDPDHPDMGDLALAAALGYIDFRHAARDWRATRPALAAFADTLAKRPSLQASLPRD